MSEEKILKATHGSPDHPLKIGDLTLPCYVLEDGRRVLHQSGMIASLGMSKGGATKGLTGDRLTKFIAGKALESYISKDLSERIKNPIKFKILGKGTSYGYEATILADICEAVLAARKADKLQKQQLHIAEKCEILMRGFARVGIIALIDEATGYQIERDKNELHKILEAYISKELLPWTRRFPPEFYQELFRLRNWQYSPMSVKRPILVGKLTNKLVYEKLPPGVLDELKKKNPPNRKGVRRYKHHQFLTEDIGNPHLERQITAVVPLMRAASNWPNFKRLFARAFPTAGQMELDLDDTDDEE